ncbi:alpha-amylase family glycosyl hydrolase [Clostridium sp. AL.422]|uniref:alpha-amylase family glycosyl hydrolase n=1 Tax=Clostridium TaxID=1485 RepID=UPI00293DA9CB|nr:MULTISPECIES: alpha-amylase family glycosyl hydrolase [unclassified Clostridium]MDV4152199.1 alpha-amylase family glycosyl hydrolase [Clostridium sp. AL.422]
MKKKKTLYLPILFILLLILSTILFIKITKNDNDSGNKPFSWDNLSLYFVMTDRFYDGDESNNNSYGRLSIDAKGSTVGTFHGGDIKGLTKKLKDNYFTDLGINAIWITSPIEQVHGFISGDNSGSFAHYGYHGYYALDWTSIDKNMGTIDDMREFVDTAHSKGIRIVLDVVMNHTGYSNLKDMADYDFKPLKDSSIDIATWQPNESENYDTYNKTIVDYHGHEEEWAKWWGNEWIRAGLPGYTSGGSNDININLSGLPDIKTELTKAVDIPPILKIKWAKDISKNNEAWIVPSAIKYRTNLDVDPSTYIIKWLSAWVEEFGIDGFRCDTAKHIDIYRWQQLKDESNKALNTWRKNNPDSPGSNWSDDFWMTGEVFGQGLEKNQYYDNGFDSIINFDFPKGDSLEYLEEIYSEYDDKINSDDNFNVLSYISSHDTGLTRGNMINLGTKLLLSPGGVEIYYGDESNRKASTNTVTTAKDQPSRSDMNWDSIDKETLSHWQKLGQFRANHISIGAGEHKMLQYSPYAFSRSYNKNSINDKVVIATEVQNQSEIDVSSVWNDEIQIKDFYTGKKYTVQDGKVNVNPNKNGIVLLEEIK